MSYELRIEHAPLGYLSTYRAALLKDGLLLDSNFTETKWGARAWAKRIIRKDKKGTSGKLIEKRIYE